MTNKSSPFRSDSKGHPVLNKLLLSLSPGAFSVVRPNLEWCQLPLRANLTMSEQPAEFAYFLNTGIVSLIISTEQGESAEVSVVGREGMAGACFAVGLRRNPFREMMQLGGEGFRIRFLKLQDILDRSPEIQRVLSRYAVYQGMEIAQIAGCNRLHDAAQRLARWLLMVQDRAETDAIPGTHDFLAILLGTTRPSVSVIAAGLQKKGAIRYSRGQIHIVDRKRLEAATCECYRVLANWSIE
jgi:CRP-like cAMP-binding protein